MTKHVVILNGPPGSGKDTIAVGLNNRLPIDHMEFKRPLYAIAAALFGVSVDNFTRAATDRTMKETNWNVLNGMTPRDVMIMVSEDMVKPNLSADHFGKVAYTGIMQSDCDTVVFSDGGFHEELEPLVVNGCAITLVRLNRQGFSFEGDSRDYLYPHWDDIPSLNDYDVYLKDGDIKGAIADVLACIVTSVKSKAA